jgi:tetratricopeptide (TPR) repeat protein
MSNPVPYKRTLFDRLGPDAANIIRAVSYGMIVFAFTLPMFATAAQKHQPPLGAWTFPWVVGCSLGTALFAGGFGLGVAHLVAKTWKHFAVDGTSTPYKEQYSYQQALVMRGQLDEALESFEAVIVEKPEAIDPRVRLAELYSREKRNYERAAELFREIQRIPGIKPGEDIYATNRLVDLLTGPLDDPARALTELRRLIDAYPSSPAIAHARNALAALKERVHAPERS